VYVNGLHQRPGGDYILTGSTIVFAIAPPAGSTVDLRYSGAAQPAAYDPPSPVAGASFSSGAGASITWYHDQAHTQPAYGFFEGMHLFGALNQPATASSEGQLADGVLIQPDQNDVEFIANPSILPCHTLEGLQPLPCDLVFYTRVDNLPWISSHSIGDGSGYCENGRAFDQFCQGDPLKGTGWYAAVAPVGSTCVTTPGGTVYQGNPGTYLGGGSPSGSGWQTNYDCHPVFPASGINFGPTLQPTILTGNEPVNRMLQPVYASFGGPFPNLNTGAFNLFRESGAYVNPAVNCNSTGTSAANPSFLNCKPGGAQPYYLSAGGIDAHAMYLDPWRTGQTWELYNDYLFGAFGACQSGGMTCNLGSGRHISWFDYKMPSTASIGAAGTPETQLQLTLRDLAMAAIDPLKYPIAHAFSFTEPGYSLARGNANSNRFVWPAMYFSGSPNYNNWGAIEGYRKRLDPMRASLQGGLSSVTATNLGSGYPAGTVLTGTVSGCQSIDGVRPASVIAYVGAAGSVVKNPSGGQVFMYISDTGINCNNPTVAFPASPTGGATVTATVTVWNLASYSASEQNMLQALYAQATQFGGEVDDVGYSSYETFRTDVQLNNPAFSQYRKAVADFYSSMTQGMGDSNLWGWVDTSSLIPAWAPGMQQKSWLVANTNPSEGATVQHQNLIKLTTAAGVTSYNPVPVLPVGVVFNVPNMPDELNIVAGTETINLAQYAHVTGDATNAGVIFSWVTDPCPDKDTLLSNGLYTACPSFAGPGLLSGQMKVTAAANPEAFALIWVTVLPGFDANNRLSIDSGGSGGCVSGGSFTAGKACNPGAGTTWVADCRACMYFTGPMGGQADYPHWPWTVWGGPAAPQSVAGESSIYQSYVYGNPDYTVSMIVPNGNYAIRVLAGVTNRGGNSNTQTSVLIPYYDSSAVYATQGQVQRWAYCAYCQDNYQSEEPVDVMLYATVTDHVLKIAGSGYAPSHWLGWSAEEKGGNPAYTFLSGLQISQDTTTLAHWEIGSYVPGTSGGTKYTASTGTITGTGDNFTIPLSNGTAYSTKGAPQPGILQLYIRDVLTGLAAVDPVWSVSGSGTISATGMYTAPTVMPANNACDTVTAQSATNPNISVTQQICFTTQ
jgi:hypothetical protein